MGIGPIIAQYLLGRLEERRQRALGGMTPEEGKEQRAWIELGGDLVKSGVVEAEDLNAIFKETFGMPGIFTTPRLGATPPTVEKRKLGPEFMGEMPVFGELFKKERPELIPGKPGYRVTAETKRKSNLIEALREKGYTITPKQEIEFLTGLEEPKPQQKSAAVQEYEIWRDDPANTGKNILDFLREKTRATQTLTGTSATIQYLADNLFGGNINRAWNEYLKSQKKGTQTGAYTYQQLVNHATAFANSKHGTQIEKLTDEDRMRWEETRLKYIKENSKFVGKVPSGEEVSEEAKRGQKIFEELKRKINMDIPPPLNADDYEVGSTVPNNTYGTLWIVRKNADGTKRWERVK